MKKKTCHNSILAQKASGEDILCQVDDAYIMAMRSQSPLHPMVRSIADVLLVKLLALGCIGNSLQRNILCRPRL